MNNLKSLFLYSSLFFLNLHAVDDDDKKNQNKTKTSSIIIGTTVVSKSPNMRVAYQQGSGQKDAFFYAWPGSSSPVFSISDNKWYQKQGKDVSTGFNDCP